MRGAMRRLRHRRCADRAASETTHPATGETMRGATGETTHPATGETMRGATGETMRGATGETMRGAGLAQSRASKAKPQPNGSVTGRNADRDSGGRGWRRVGSERRVTGRNSGDLLGAAGTVPARWW
jgi:hypothetical protein